MKFLFLFLPVFSVALHSCKKDTACRVNAPATVASASEKAYLQAYLNANSITAVEKTGNVL